MTSSELLNWVEIIGSLVFSWPVMITLALIVFRKPLYRLVEQMTGVDVKRAKFGPVEIERELKSLAYEGRQAVDVMNQINVIMAESRLLELEITESLFGAMFSEDQRIKMQQHIAELRKLTRRANESKVVD